MANYYLHFSVMLNNLSKPEEEWARLELARLAATEGDDGTSLHDFNAVFERDPIEHHLYAIWFYSEEYASVEQVADFVQSFLKKFRPKARWGFEWATRLL